MVPAGLRRWLESGRTGVKVCGVTREEDARAAIEAGVDALGFNFYAGSKRCVRLGDIAGWVGLLPAEVGRIAVVVNADEALLRELQESALFHACQFHGGEAPETAIPHLAFSSMRMHPGCSEAPAASSIGRWPRRWPARPSARLSFPVG
jgi:hypothetical protein